MSIFGRKKQIAARTKYVVKEDDPIARGNGQKKGIERRARPQTASVSGAHPSGGIEFIPAIQGKLQLRPASNDGDTREVRCGRVEIMQIILRLYGRKRQTAKGVQTFAREKRTAQLQLGDQRKFPIGNSARSGHHSSARKMQG